MATTAGYFGAEGYLVMDVAGHTLGPGFPWSRFMNYLGNVSATLIGCVRSPNHAPERTCLFLFLWVSCAHTQLPILS